MKVFVVAKKKDEVYKTVSKLFEIVGDIADCDIVITIGGDGTILGAGISAAIANKPLLGINTGRLGFMATLEKDELWKLGELKMGRYSKSRRMLLNVNGTLALNDVVFHRKSSRLSEFTVFSGDVEETIVEVFKVRADGVIISTPTGSTAYSLSAGGPIIEPELECFLVTALSPHTLFNRPIIFSHDRRLTVKAKDITVSIDGQESEFSDYVVVTKSEYHLDLINIIGHNFYDSIHNKLMKPLK